MPKNKFKVSGTIENIEFGPDAEKFLNEILLKSELQKSLQEFVDRFYKITKTEVRNKFGGKNIYRKFTDDPGEVWEWIENKLNIAFALGKKAGELK